MRTSILAFVIGVCALHMLPVWPPSVGLLATVGTCGFALLRLGGARGVLPRRVGALVVGALWAGWHVQLGLASRLPPDLAGVALEVRGRVVTLPREAEGSRRFEVDVQSVRRGAVPGPALRRVALSDYGSQLQVAAGMQCTLYVRLRPPRGVHNPAGVDVERLLFARRIDATGYVVTHPANACADAGLAGMPDRLRARIAAAIAASVADPATAAVLQALAIGAATALDDGQWQVLQATGTTHVISISGLHVSMVALAVYAGVRALFALSPAWTRRVAAPLAGMLVGLGAATAYAVLAGFAVPTQRTLIMLACLAWQRWRGQRALNADGLLMALGIVVVVDPLAVLTASLWLSFGAMAALVLLAALLNEGRAPLRACGVHLWLALLLSPVLAFVSPFLAWTSPLANLVVVPFVTWGVVPLTLLGVLLHAVDAALAATCWHYAAVLWEHGWRALAWLADTAPAWRLPHAVPAACVPLVWLGLLLPLLPLGTARWWLAPLLVACPWFTAPPAVPHGAARVTVYDVGQGLAVLVQTRQHALLYDAGPRTRGGRDAGRSVVLPNLRAAGVWHLDRLVLSHPDIDHAGGADSVLAGVDVAEVIVSPRDPRPRRRASRCEAGQAWAWDGVDFAVLHPDRDARGDDNQLSCVLAITSAAGSRLILTGDIDAAAEARLVARGTRVAADVLVAPHHGSGTSSSADFVAAVAPREVVHTAGHGNRYGFPAPAVVARYAALGARQHVTGAHGAILVELGAGRPRVTRWRAVARHYWQAR